MMCELGVDGYELLGFGAGGFDHFDIFNRFHTEIGDTPLLATTELSRPTEHEVELGKFKPILCGRKRLEAFL